MIGAGYQAVWFLFKGEPFDLGRFYRPDGSWTGIYVDILEPVSWRGADPTTLEPLVDLFLDIWITPEKAFQVLDEDEFTAACAAGSLTAAQDRSACATLARLLTEIRSGTFPPPEVWSFDRGELV